MNIQIYETSIIIDYWHNNDIHSKQYYKVGKFLYITTYTNTFGLDTADVVKSIYELRFV